MPLKKTMTLSQTIEKKIAASITNDPLLTGTAIQIMVTDDCVVLSGSVNQYRKQLLAVQIATKIAFPKTINQEIKVVPEVTHNDDAIATEIADRLGINFGFASDKITVTVNNGKVRLQGQMSWSYQKDLALESISDIDGICDISNEITVSPVSNENLIRKQILNMLTMVTSREIDIIIHGTDVILKGSVGSADEKNAIRQAIGRICGIGKIRNELHVGK